MFFALSRKNSILFFSETSAFVVVFLSLQNCHVQHTDVHRVSQKSLCSLYLSHLETFNSRRPPRQNDHPRGFAAHDAIKGSSPRFFKNVKSLNHEGDEIHDSARINSLPFHPQILFTLLHQDGKAIFKTRLPGRVRACRRTRKLLIARDTSARDAVNRINIHRTLLPTRARHFICP